MTLNRCAVPVRLWCFGYVYSMQYERVAVGRKYPCRNSMNLPTLEGCTGQKMDFLAVNTAGIHSVKVTVSYTQCKSDYKVILYWLHGLTILKKQSIDAKREI